MRLLKSIIKEKILWILLFSLCLSLLTLLKQVNVLLAVNQFSEFPQSHLCPSRKQLCFYLELYSSAGGDVIGVMAKIESDDSLGKLGRDLRSFGQSYGCQSRYELTYV